MLGLNVDPNTFMKDYEFRGVGKALFLGEVAIAIEQYIETLYDKLSGGKMQIQVQVTSMWPSASSSAGYSQAQGELDLKEQVEDHFTSGDTVIVETIVMGPVSDPQIQLTEEDIEDLRQQLRFGLNDRVMCWVGPRWLSGWIVGTAVPDDNELLPYLVKTDPLPGLPSSTISVPSDSNEVCIQETCFDPRKQLHLVKAAASMVSETNKPRLRFAVGEKVVCRICSSPQDGLEQWVAGEVSEIWPVLPGEKAWNMGEVAGEYPDVVPYKVTLASGWVFCHKDDHTLIRRENMQPLTRVRGISKRMEVRKHADGSKEHIDHVTERRKHILNAISSDSD